MLKLRVAALSINNLTDARYFAAYMVDWIGFNINPASQDYLDREKLMEILGWVEGPQYLLQGVEWNEDAGHIIDQADQKIQGVILNGEDTRFDNMQIFSYHNKRVGDFMLFDNLKQFLDSGLPAIYAFIRYQQDPNLVSELLDMDEPPGLYLYGGNEETVGLKDFDELDQVFDLLYE